MRLFATIVAISLLAPLNGKDCANKDGTVRNVLESGETSCVCFHKTSCNAATGLYCAANVFSCSQIPFPGRPQSITAYSVGPNTLRVLVEQPQYTEVAIRKYRVEVVYKARHPYGMYPPKRRKSPNQQVAPTHTVLWNSKTDYLFETKKEATEACHFSGFPGLCTKAQDAGFTRCGFAYYTDGIGFYWDNRAKVECGYGKDAFDYQDVYWAEKAFASCCGAPGNHVHPVNILPNVPGNITVFEVDLQNASTLVSTVYVLACNDDSCSENYAVGSTGQPCQPPTTYLKNNVCVACPHDQVSSAVDAKSCSPININASAVPLTILHPGGPAILVTASIPTSIPYLSHVIVRTYHKKMHTTAGLLNQTNYWNSISTFAMGAPVLVDTVQFDAPQSTGNPVWTLEANINTHHRYVGVLPLQADIMICRSQEGGEICSTKTVNVPLVFVNPQLPPPILQQSSINPYSLMVTLRPPTFFLGSQNTTNRMKALAIDPSAFYEVKYRLVNSTDIFSVNISLPMGESVLINNLLGSPKAYKCQVMLHTGKKSSNFSLWSNSATTVKGPGVPQLAGIKPKVVSLTETLVLLTVSTPWAGRQPLQYVVEWFPEPECGERNFGSLEAKLSRQSFSSPISIPDRLQPETTYTIRISASVLDEDNNIISGSPSDAIHVTTAASVSFRHISKDGDDTQCANASKSVACQHIISALDLYPFSGYQFQVSVGEFQIKRSLYFPNRNMGLNGSGIGRTIVLCKASPCVNISGMAVPSMLSGATFRNHGESKTHGIYVRELQSKFLIQYCAFENFDNAMVLDGILPQVQLVHLKFINNQALNDGAAVSIKSCSQVEIIKSFFYQNDAKRNGGAIHMSSSNLGSLLEIEDSTFDSNTAQSGGAIFVDRGSRLRLERIELVANKAFSGGALSIISATTNLRHIDVLSTNARQALQCTGSQIDMLNVSILNSTGLGLEGLFCSANIESCAVQNNRGGIKMVSMSELTVQNSSFFGNHAPEDGGGIACSNCAFLTILPSVFRNNSAPRGGAIAVSSTPATINASILHNKARLGGGGGIFWNSIKPIIESDLRDNMALYGANIASSAKKCINKGGKAVNGSNSAALPSIFIQLLDYYNHPVFDLVTSAATLTAASNQTLLGTTVVSVLKSNSIATFSDLILAAKSGIHFLKFTVQNSPEVIDNVLQVNIEPCKPGTELRPLTIGGFQCQECSAGMFNSKTQSTCKACDLGRYSSMAGQMECNECVRGRFADQEGSLKCADCDPGMYTPSNGSHVCNKCQDGRYQRDKAAVECKRCSNDGEFPNERKTDCLPITVDTSLPRLMNLQLQRSGDHIILCSYDWPDGVVISDYKIKAHASTTRDFSTYVLVKDYTENQTAVLTTDQPVYDAALYFRLAVYDVKDPSQQGPWAVQLDNYNVTSSCSEIEYLNDSSIYVQDWSCDICPTGAKCTGNIRYEGVKGKFGFWRVPGAPPQTFQKCLFAAACLGAANEEEVGKYFNYSSLDNKRIDLARINLPEQCYISWGYAQECSDGQCRLCGTCLPGYERASQARCKICPATGTNRALLAFGVIALVLGAALIVALSVQATASVVTVSEATKKIILNYLQVASLAAIFPMEWPEELQTFFAIQSAISSASKNLLSPDCELSWMVAAESFYLKQIGFSVLPIVIVNICCFTWYLAFITRRSCGNGSYKDRAILSCVVLLYLIYPTLVKQGMAMVSCKRIGEKYWLLADLQEPCMEGRHLLHVFTVLIPQVLLYILGLPLVATLTLYRNRNQLFHDESIQIRYGILYAGYRVEVFWWETTLVVRKIVLIVIGGVLGAGLRPDLQVYTALGIVVIFIVMHLYVRPFDELTKFHQSLHRLELTSLLVCWATFYSGMIFWVGNRLPKSVLLIISICIITINCSFVFYAVTLFVRSWLRENVKGSSQSIHSLRLTSMIKMTMSSPSQAGHDVEMVQRLTDNPLNETSAQKPKNVRIDIKHSKYTKARHAKKDSKTWQPTQTTPMKHSRKFRKFETAEGETYFVEVGGLKESVWKLPKDGEVVSN